MKQLCLIMMVLYLLLGVSSCKKSQEQPNAKTVKKVEKKVEKKVRKKSQAPMAVESGDATIKIVEGSGNVLGIELTNKVPIRGVQFILEGAQASEVHTTSRTKGFVADFNKASGKVVILSVSGGKIPSGTGAIAEVVCDKKDSASLSDIKLIK